MGRSKNRDVRWSPDRVEALADRIGTRKELADRVGTSPWVITMWIKGDYKPSEIAQNMLDRVEGDLEEVAS